MLFPILGKRALLLQSSASRDLMLKHQAARVSQSRTRTAGKATWLPGPHARPLPP